MSFNKKSLPIDLLICNTIDFKTAFKTIEYNSQFFNFNKKIILSNSDEKIKGFEIINIGKFKSIQEYSDFMPRLIEFSSSDYLLLIQDDGFIINHNNWNDEFLNYDYIGAPWPSSKRWIKRFKKYDYYDVVKNNIQKNRVGNGGFSLRSKKFLEYCSKFNNCNNVPEDIFFCLLNYELAQKSGIKFADYETAYKFSAEHSFSRHFNKHPKKNINIDPRYHFGWHGKRSKNYEDLMGLKYNI